MAPSPDPERAQCFMGARGHQSIVIGVGKEGNTADWRRRVASPAWGAGRRLGVDKVLGKDTYHPQPNRGLRAALAPSGWLRQRAGILLTGLAPCCTLSTASCPLPPISGNSCRHPCPIPQVEGNCGFKRW